MITVTALAGAAYKTLSDSIGDTLKYAAQVRQLSQVSGQSAEATSRFIQVLDDYKISADDAMVATRALTKEGYAPSIDTLAQLSDKYLSLNSAQEKNDFVLKNLGRGGLQWVDVLNQGSEALRKQGAAVSDQLILNDKMVEQARKAEIAWDNWGDAINGAKTQIGIGLIPELTKGINFLMATDAALEKVSGHGIQGMRDFWPEVQKATAEIEKQQSAMSKTGEAGNTAANGIDAFAKADEDAKKSAQDLSNILQGMLSSMFSINQANDQYAQTVADLSKSDAKLAADKNQLTLKMWEEQKAGKLTNDEYLRYVQQLDDITQSQKDNEAARAKAAEDQKKAGEQRVYDLTQQKLAADGVISTGEYEYLQNLAVAKGLVTRAAADQAIAENKQADELVRNFSMTQGPMDESLSTMKQIASFDGHIVQFGVNFTTTGASMNAALAGMGGTANPAGYQPSTVGSYGSNTPNGTYHPINFGSIGSSFHDMDSGGTGVAGTPYLIGAGAQPELFVPHTSGTFIPNADKKMGSTTIVNIYNPVPAKSETSIRQELKKLSYLGVAS
jgi:hypothetical protein